MQETNRPVNQPVKVLFFKETGKYYASGTATVNHFLFEEGFKQDIVNTQDCLQKNWMGNFQVMTEEVDDADNAQGAPSFATHLFESSEFRGIRYQDESEEENA